MSKHDVQLGFDDAMRICPDCSSRLEGIACPQCDWTAEEISGIPVFLSSSDRASPSFQQYFELYESISSDDLNESIVDAEVLAVHAGRLATEIQDWAGIDYCDIGVGQGELIREALARHPRSVVAIDIAAQYLRMMPEGVESVLANAENLPFRDAFDLVTATDVMEHVLNVGSFIYSVHRALRIGGRFVVRVPYQEDLLQYSPHLGAKYEYVHLRSFDRRSLSRALEAAGFKVTMTRVGGFSLQSPSRFWATSYRRQVKFNQIQARVSAKLDNPADINRLPSWLLRLFLRPYELTAHAEKICEEITLGSAAYSAPPGVMANANSRLVAGAARINHLLIRYRLTRTRRALHRLWVWLARRDAG
jgi:2-polyprenyl-3-methyl-5-hydroxy-6-metoxy-1,4-benzoquinol methylase